MCVVDPWYLLPHRPSRFPHLLTPPSFVSLVSPASIQGTGETKTKIKNSWCLPLVRCGSLVFTPSLSLTFPSHIPHFSLIFVPLVSPASIQIIHRAKKVCGRKVSAGLVASEGDICVQGKCIPVRTPHSRRGNWQSPLANINRVWRVQNGWTVNNVYLPFNTASEPPRPLNTALEPPPTL